MKKYDTYKDSGIEWIGEIPEHWKSTKLKYIGESIIGIIYSPGDVVNEDEGILVLRSSNIQNGKLAFEDNVFVNKPIKEKHLTKEGDILLCARNGSAHLVGKSAYIDKENENISFGAFMSIVRSNLGKYLFYFFNSQIFKSQTGLFSTSTINQLTSDTLNNMLVSFPKDEHEQTAIAEYLDKKTTEIDKLISDKEELLKLYEEEKTAVINHAVTKGINPDAKMKDSGIEWLGEIPEHWEVKKLKYVSKINPSKNQAFKGSEDEVVFLPMEKVNEDGTFDQELVKPINELWNGYTYFEKGDILIAKITPCFENGKGTLLSNLKTKIGFGSTEFHVVRSKSVISQFLFYLTRSFRFMKIGEAFMTGAAGQKRVPTDFISEFNVAIPPYEEQQSIVNFIESETSRIGHKIEDTQKLIDLLKEYREALISEVVTGKMKVV